MKMQKIIQQALQPEILGQIKIYAGLTQPINKKSEHIYNLQKGQIIKKWLFEIGVQRKEISKHDIFLLWYLYLAKINNVPRKDYLEKAIKIGLNYNIFYSKIFEYDKEFKSLNLFESQYECDGDLLNFIKENNVENGDVIYLKYHKYPFNICYYESESIFFLSVDNDNPSKFLNPNFIYNNWYPIPEYFKNIFDTYVGPQKMILFDSQDYELNYIKEYQTHSYEHRTIYQYIAKKGNNIYTIYTVNTDFKKKFKDMAPNLYFSYDMWVMSLRLRDFMETIIDKNNLKILYDIVNYQIEN